MRLNFQIIGELTSETAKTLAATALVTVLCKRRNKSKIHELEIYDILDLSGECYSHLALSGDRIVYSLALHRETIDALLDCKVLEAIKVERNGDRTFVLNKENLTKVRNLKEGTI